MTAARDDSGDVVDVLILGAGLAGLCLTRLLQRRRPDVRILSLDTAPAPSRKVGESTVEIGAHFLHRRLGLASLLGTTQLPKNGLRFWFDSAAHDQSLAESSEDGPLTFAYWQTFQLDREVLERSLGDLNRAAGARHLFGIARPRLEERHAPDAPHRLSYERDGQRHTVSARWLVDATGPTALRSRGTGRLRPETRIPHGACWARFRGFRAPDSRLKEAGQRRQVVGRRLLSTNHLMNEGYWIWWIPLAPGLMSVGLVWDATVLADPPTTLEAFERFLARHRMCRELMEESEPLDFGHMSRYAMRPDRFFEKIAAREAAIGVAAGFVDPFYSSGSDFIALECEYLADFIGLDLDGRPADEARVDAADTFLRAFYEQTILFVSDLYKTFASFELSVPRYRRDLHVYWCLYAWPYISGAFRDVEALAAFPAVAERTRVRSAFFARLYRHVYDHLRRHGRLRRLNRGRYAYNQLGYDLVPFLRFERQMGHPVDFERCARLLDENDVATLLALLDIRLDGDRSPLRGPLFAATARLGIDAVLAIEARLGCDDAFFAELIDRLGASLTAVLRERGLAVEEIELGPESWAPAPREEALRTAAGGDPDLEAAVVRELRALPVLEPVALPPGRDTVQPVIDWTFDHTPWEIEPLDTRTVYELMAMRPRGPVTALYSAEATPDALAVTPDGRAPDRDRTG